MQTEKAPYLDIFRVVDRRSLLHFNLTLSMHRFTANDYVMFPEIWNEFRVLKNSDFLINHNLRK